MVCKNIDSISILFSMCAETTASKNACVHALGEINAASQTLLSETENQACHLIAGGQYAEASDLLRKCKTLCAAIDDLNKIIEEIDQFEAFTAEENDN